MYDLGAQHTASWNQLYVDFLLRGEHRRTRRKTLEAEKRTNTNSTHLWRRLRESNQGHFGGRWEASAITTAPSLLPFWAFKDGKSGQGSNAIKHHSAFNKFKFKSTTLFFALVRSADYCYNGSTAPGSAKVLSSTYFQRSLIITR